MRVFISVDIEGVTGVCSPAECDEFGSERWLRACAEMRADLDAALAGCAAAGVAEVVVSDGHDTGYNLHPDGLPAGVTLVSGAQQDLSMMQGIDPGFDAALFVGYHAMAGTEAGTLAHTWDGELTAVRVVTPAGDADPEAGGRRGVGQHREVGELGLNAAVAGAFGVPLVFASGDDKLAAEARAFVPGVETAVVKEGVSRTAARLSDPGTARAAIRAGVERALRAARRPGSSAPAPLHWDGRALELEFGRAEWCDQAAICPGTRRLDGRRLLIEAPDWLSVYRAFVACAALAER